MPQSAYLHEGLDFPEYFEAGDDHGFGWLDRSALWRRTTLLQSVMLSLCVHIAVISIFVFGPGNAVSVRSPWLEVRLVSLGSDEVAAGSGQEGGSGGSRVATGPVPENPPVPEVLPPVPPVVEKVREKEPKPTVSLAAALPRPVSKPKQPAKVPAVQREPCDAEALSPRASQPADAAASPSSGAGSPQATAESGEGGSGAAGSAHGKGSHGGHEGGPVDAEFGAANGPRFAHKSLPHYPRLARQLGKEATVVLRVTIDERGHPIVVEVVKTAGSGFDEEAIRAVKESLFHPAKREGRPVICRAILPIRFELRGSE